MGIIVAGLFVLAYSLLARRIFRPDRVASDFRAFWGGGWVPTLMQDRTRNEAEGVEKKVRHIHIFTTVFGILLVILGLLTLVYPQM